MILCRNNPSKDKLELQMKLKIIILEILILHLGLINYNISHMLKIHIKEHIKK